MKTAISGSTGFIGKQLTNYLLQNGNEIIMISRKDFTGTDNQLAKLIISADVILNLAGSSVLWRWNERNKQQILCGIFVPIFASNLRLMDDNDLFSLPIG